MKFLIFLIIVVGMASPASAQTCGGSPEQIVTCEQVKIGGPVALRDPAVIVRFLRNVADSLNREAISGGPFGVLVKTGGHNCDGYSCDIICAGNGANQKQWDVLRDAGGESAPVWSGPLPEIAARPCEIGAAPIPTPDPAPVPPVDLSDILRRLDALERETANIGRLASDVRAELRAEVADIRTIIAELPSVVLPPYKGSLWGIGIVSRPCPTCK